jgi:excisionase family DNA binding protein
MAGVHPTTVLRAIERGELAAVRLGANGHYRIRCEALEAWMQPTTGGDTT